MAAVWLDHFGLATRYNAWVYQTIWFRLLVAEVSVAGTNLHSLLMVNHTTIYSGQFK